MNATFRRHATTLLVTLIAALWTSGCLHVSRTTIYDDGKMKIQLRARGEATEGMDQPVIIAAVRISHILARIDIRMSAKEGQKRVPAIPLESLEKISAGLAKGLAEADSNQEVVLISKRTEKRFAVFNHDKLTSFTAYVRDGILYFHLSRSDWEIPPRREKRLPEPTVGEFPQNFRIVSDRSMEMVDQQSLAIDWKAKLFATPTRTRVTPDGRTIRRTILMESEVLPDDAPTEPLRPEIAPIPPGISPQALRALADLEDKRRNGSITEAGYARKRLEILEEEASR